MDPVGFTASLLTLVQTAVVVGNAAVKLHRDLKDAPQQLEQVSRQILDTKTHLDMLIRLRQGPLSALGRNGYLMVPPKELMALHVSIKDAENCLNAIQDFQILLDKAPGKRTCFRWVLKDRSPVLKLLGHLQEIERALTALLAILQMLEAAYALEWSHTKVNRIISAASYSSVLDIASKQDLVLEELQELKNLTLLETGNYLQIESSADTNPSTLRHRASQRCHVVQKGSTCLPRIWKWKVAEGSWPDVGVRSSVAFRNHWNEWQSTYTVSGSLQMPSILSNYVVTVNIQLKLFKVSWPSIAPSLGLRNIVRFNSEFLKACRDGNIAIIRQLALNGKGSATDMDVFGRPAMDYAVQSGSVETVQLMLDMGANVNELNHSWNGNPLQMACLKVGYGEQFRDVARLLISNGASVDHVNASGRTTLSTLYYGRSDSRLRLEFVKLLLSNSVLCYTAEDERVECSVCAAAPYGSEDEIKLLVKSGASLRNAERALRESIRYSNLSTYDYLVRQVRSSWVNEMDSEGKTPLTSVFSFQPVPYSARVGMIKRLLDAGANVHLRDQNGTLPEYIASREQTCYKKDYPRSWQYEGKGGLAVEAYIEALRLSGYDVSVDDEGDFLWPAEDKSAFPVQQHRGYETESEFAG